MQHGQKKIQERDDGDMDQGGCSRIQGKCSDLDIVVWR